MEAARLAGTGPIAELCPVPGPTQAAFHVTGPMSGTLTCSMWMVFLISFLMGVEKNVLANSIAIYHVLESTSIFPSKDTPGSIWFLQDPSWRIEQRYDSEHHTVFWRWSRVPLISTTLSSCLGVIVFSDLLSQLRVKGGSQLLRFTLTERCNLKALDAGGSC